MTLTSCVTITSDVTKHRAYTVRVNAGQPESWQVSWLPDWLLTRDQAAVALNIAELVGSHFTAPANGMEQLREWAALLGLAPNDAVKRLTDRHSWELAVRGSDLAWEPKSLLLLLGTYIHINGVYRQPAIADLSRDTGLGEQLIVETLLELQASGWFSWHAVTGVVDFVIVEREDVLPPEPAAALTPVRTVPRDGDAI